MPQNNGYRRALMTSAIALGMSKGDAQSTSNADLEAFLRAEGRASHQADSPGKPGIPTGQHQAAQGGMRATSAQALPENQQVVLEDGDLVITLKDGLMRKAHFTQEDDAEPVLSLLDENGATVDFPQPFRPGVEYVNTGLKIGDLVGDNERPYLEITDFQDDHTLLTKGARARSSWSRDNSDGDIMNYAMQPHSQREGSGEIAFTSIERHYPMQDGREFELTQDGVNFLSQLNSLTQSRALNISSLPLVCTRSRVKPFPDVEGVHLNVMPHGDGPDVSPALRYTPDGTDPTEYAAYPIVMQELQGSYLPVMAKNVQENKRQYDGKNLINVLQAMPLDAFEPVYRTEEVDMQAMEAQSMREDGKPFDPSRRTLADVKGRQSPERKKQVVPDEKVRELVEQTMGDSDKLQEVVKAALEGDQEGMREALGITEDLDTLGESMINDVEAAFERLKEEQEQWRRDTEEKMTMTVEFQDPEKPTVTVDNAHARLPELLFNARLRKHTLLVGPSGSGKTTSAKIAAETLGLPFSSISLGPTQTETKFAGYTDAYGRYVPTEFYQRYRYGGLFLMDEMDAGNSGALTWINSALANKVASFPVGMMGDWEKQQFHPEAYERGEEVPTGGMIEAHPDFVVVASANTFGKGADLVYQGRTALDGATLKRFKVIYWDYDERLERALTGDDLWVAFVQAIRESVRHVELHHIVSPVDSIDGAQMIAAGKAWRSVAHETVLAGLTEADRTKILNPEGAARLKRRIADAHNALNEREAGQNDLGILGAGAAS